MPTTIDSLQIEIQTSSASAASGINALATSLAELKKSGTITTVVKNLNKLSEALSGLTSVHRSANALRTLANSIDGLKEVGSVASIVNSLKKLPEAFQAIENIDIGRVAPQIQAIVVAISPLSNVKAGGFGTMVNAMKNLAKITESLDEATISAFAAKVSTLNERLGPLSEKMSTIRSGFGAINSGARQAASGIGEFAGEIDASALNLTSFIEIIRTVAQAIQAVIQKLSEFISQAIEWDGVAARFGRGFGAQASETYAWIQRLNEEMGINIQQFMQYSSIYATMLTGFGVANEDATKMALGYAELTYDIWAGYNDVYKTFEEASEAVKSAIAGEVEPIRRAGFTIIETTLEQTAANHGLEISLANATEAQKSYLRYLTLVDQAHAQNLVGTYAKELNTAEGLMRTFAQQLKSLTQAFGSLFLPILVRVMPWVQAFVELLTEGVYWLANLLGVEIQPVDFSGYESGAGAIEDVANSANSATGALNDATKAAKELKNATIGIDELNVISPPSSASNGGSGGAGGGAGGGFAGLDVDSLWDETIFDTIQSDVDEIKEKLRGWLPVIASVAGALAGLRLLKLLNDIKEISNLGGLFTATGGILPKLSTWLSGLPAALSAAAPALSAAAPYIAIVAAVVAGIALAFIEYDFTDLGYKIGNAVGSALKSAWEFIRDGLVAAFEWAVDALDIDDIWDVLAIIFVPGEFYRRIKPELDEIFAQVTEWIEEKIDNLKGNINEFFSGFFDGLFDGLGIDMSWAKEFASFFDIEYLDIVEMIISPTSIGKHIITGITKGIDSNATLSSIKDNLVKMWDNAKTWWNEKKEALKSYTPSIGNIASKLSTAWTDAKNWWNDKRSSLSYTPSIGKIWEKLRSAWDSAKNWWNDKRSSLSYTPSIGSISSKLSSAWTSAKNWWNKSRSSLSYTPSIGSIVDKVKSAWNTAKSWWNKNVSLSTKLNIKVPTIKVNWAEARAFGITFK